MNWLDYLDWWEDASFICSNEKQGTEPRIMECKIDVLDYVDREMVSKK